MSEEEKVQIGRKVIRRSVKSFTDEGNINHSPMTGTVVYIHPQGRFHMVEFENRRGVKWRECYLGVAGEQPKYQYVRGENPE